MEEKALIVAEKLDVAVLFTSSGMEETLNKIREKAMAHVPDISTEQGRKDIAGLAHKVARSKTLIDDLGKDMVADWKKKAKAIDEHRKTARDFLDVLKADVRKPLDDFDAEQARIKEEEDRKEREKIDARVHALSEAGCRLSFFEIAGLADDEYEDRLRKATEAHQAEQKRLADEEAARKAEAERLEKQRQEQEAEAARLAELQRQADEANRKEREAIEAEKRKIEAEKKALEDAKRAEQERKDREAFEAQAKENARIAAEIAAAKEVERKARETQERMDREAAEKARAEALKPDKTKLLEWCDWMDSDNIPKPSIQNEEAQTILYDALHALRSWVNDIRKRTEAL